MPINIPTGLPAASVLTAERVFVMTHDRAQHQDIRPLELLFLNLMPKKIATEIQYMRKLSGSPIQINIELLRVDEHVSRNTPQSHLDTFYRDFAEIRNRYFDGMIITGAPLDQVDFDDVFYWQKLGRILDWGKEHVFSTLFSCWGVAAALKHFYGLPLISRSDKLSGIYRHRRVDVMNAITCGFDDEFMAPQSRFIDFPVDVIQNSTDLNVLAFSDVAGTYIAADDSLRRVMVTGHPEYDVRTLAEEYQRDLDAGKNPRVPVNYFPDDDPEKTPPFTWRAHGALLFSNWVNSVYQNTPYDFVMRRDA